MLINAPAKSPLEDDLTPEEQQWQKVRQGHRSMAMK